MLTSDFSEHALASTRARAVQVPNVRFATHALPGDWPHSVAPFDLIVVSEFGCFLEGQAMHRLATCCAESLDDDGVLIACHWRPDFPERALPTDTVHAVLNAIGLANTTRHEESDFLLQVWCCNPASVAQRGGIR